MKKLILIIVMIILFLGFYSCEGFWGITGEGEIVTETFTFDSFTSIESAIAGQIHLIENSESKVVVEAQQNIIDNLVFKHNNKKLKIRFDKNVLKYSDIDIYVYTPKFERIALSGSGNIFNDGSLDVNTLKVDLSGSGDIDLQDVEGDFLDIILSGSGKIKIDDFYNFEAFYSNISGSGKIILDATGTLQFQEINISGSGKIEATKSPTKDVEVSISGSGNCDVWAIDNLDVNISGSGNVYYKGSPQINSNISGSGNIYNDN